MSRPGSGLIHAMSSPGGVSSGSGASALSAAGNTSRSSARAMVRRVFMSLLVSHSSRMGKENPVALPGNKARGNKARRSETDGVKPGAREDADGVKAGEREDAELGNPRSSGIPAGGEPGTAGPEVCGRFGMIVQGAFWGRRGGFCGGRGLIFSRGSALDGRAYLSYAHIFTTPKSESFVAAFSRRASAVAAYSWKEGRAPAR